MTAARERLYHRVPERLTGDTLHPLNELARIYPDVAAAERAKYAHREHLMSIRLPMLDCLWNDVLHLSPINPAKIKSALLRAGASPESLGSRLFYVIDPKRLDSARAVYFANSADTAGRFDFVESDFSKFDAANYQELANVSADQREQYKKAMNAGERPLLWSRTPHVFYRGSISVDGLEQIEW